MPLVFLVFVGLPRITASLQASISSLAELGIAKDARAALDAALGALETEDGLAPEPAEDGLLRRVTPARGLLVRAGLRRAAGEALEAVLADATAALEAMTPPAPVAQSLRCTNVPCNGTPLAVSVPKGQVLFLASATIAGPGSTAHRYSKTEKQKEDETAVGSYLTFSGEQHEPDFQLMTGTPTCPTRSCSLMLRSTISARTASTAYTWTFDRICGSASVPIPILIKRLTLRHEDRRTAAGASPSGSATRTRSPGSRSARRPHRPAPSPELTEARMMTHSRTFSSPPCSRGAAAPPERDWRRCRPSRTLRRGGKESYLF